MIIGNKSTFAFDIGEQPLGSDLQTVNIIINNRNVCCDDNSAYIPQFIASLQFDVNRIIKSDLNQYEKYFEGKSISEIHEFILRTRTEGTEEYDIENDNVYPNHNFLDWGPTTDNLSCFIIPWNNRYFLTYQFWRPEHPDKSEIGKIQNAEIGLAEIVKTIEEAIATLKK